MSVRLQGLFLWLGVVVAAILFCFHLYLRERGEVRQARREVGRWKQLKGGEWGAPAVSRLTMLDYGEVSQRRLASLERKRHDGSSHTHLITADDRGGEMGVEEDSGHDVKEVNISKLSKNDTLKLTGEAETSLLNLTDRFSLKSSFSLPTPQATLPLPQLLRCQWLDDLRTHLSSLPPDSQLISIVSSDFKYREVLLNWLILAQDSLTHPLTNVLVLSLDPSLHQLLREREVPSIHIPISCLLRPGLSLTHHVAFTQVHIMRVLVMRILNHWGYDVANYDSDALVLRNPETRYRELEERHLVGSVGHFPHELDHRWGTAVCIGVVLIRASPQTELYWGAMSGVLPDTTNDQARLNWALAAMEMTWDNPHSNMAEVIMTGVGRKGFRAAVLPTRDVCRQTCVRRRERGYLIWHKGGAQNRDGKKAYASKGGLWRLRDDWQQINKRTSSKGVKWLSQISR